MDVRIWINSGTTQENFSQENSHTFLAISRWLSNTWQRHLSTRGTALKRPIDVIDQSRFACTDPWTLVATTFPPPIDAYWRLDLCRPPFKCMYKSVCAGILREISNKTSYRCLWEGVVPLLFVRVVANAKRDNVANESSINRARTTYNAPGHSRSKQCAKHIAQHRERIFYSFTHKQPQTQNIVCTACSARLHYYVAGTATRVWTRVSYSFFFWVYAWPCMNPWRRRHTLSHTNEQQKMRSSLPGSFRLCTIVEL